MRNALSLLLALGAVAASSCGRTTYPVAPPVPAYLGAVPTRVAAPRPGMPAAPTLAAAPLPAAPPTTTFPAPPRATARLGAVRKRGPARLVSVQYLGWRPVARRLPRQVASRHTVMSKLGRSALVLAVGLLLGALAFAIGSGGGSAAFTTAILLLYVAIVVVAIGLVLVIVHAANGD